MREIYAGRLPIDKNFYSMVEIIEKLAKVDFTIDPKVKELADIKMKGGTYHATQEG